VEENFAVTEPRVGATLPRDHFEVIRDYARRFLDERRDLFLERLSAGRVRDGHGDLRAQNICLFAGLGGGIQLLDCIEFNDRFRFGDVASDLAYLVMDLDLAGRADLRQVLVDRYVARAGDPSLRSVLPFYSCYRAHVRGKIALLMAAEPEVPSAERRSQERLAAAAFDLSRSYAVRRERPALLITVGYSGSGKSALAHELARRLPAVRLASDMVRKELAGQRTASPLSSEHYTAEAREAIYAELRARARYHLARGEQVLLDATFLDPEERRQAAALAEDAGAEAWLIECRCTDAMIRRRLHRRLGKRLSSDAGLAVYEAQLRAFPDLGSSELELSRWRQVCLRTNQPARQSARRFLREFWCGAANDSASPSS
jgi:predicted kinase